MSTTNNNTANYIVENLVAKYRNYVDNHCLQLSEECGPVPYKDDAEEQLLVTLYNRVAGEDADKRIKEALSEYANDFYIAALDEDEMSFLTEHFSDVSTLVFEYFASHRKRWYDHYVLSKNVKSILKTAYKPESGSTIFVADSGYCDVAMLFPECIVKGYTTHRGFDNDDEMWALGQIRLYAAGIRSEILSSEEVLSPDYIKDVDYAIWGTAHFSSYKDAEMLCQHMKEKSRMLIFMDKNDAAGTVVGGVLDTHGLRKGLVDKCIIGSIISFEEDDELLSIQRNKICILACNYSHATVHMQLTIGDEFDVSSELLDHEILWPSYYAAKKPEAGIPLSSIVSFVDLGRKWDNEWDKEYFIQRKEGEFVLSEKVKKMSVAAPADMVAEYKDANLCEANLKLAENPIFEKWEGWIRRINQPCVLLYGRGNKYVAGYVKDLPENGIATLDTIASLAPKDGIDVRYVAALLLSQDVKEQIIAICEGEVNDTTFPKVMDKVIIPDHSEKERLAFLGEVNYEALLSSQKELKKQHEQYRKSVRMRKHALTQSLSSVKSIFNALNKYRNLHNGKISDSEQISRVKGTTVREAFDFIDKNIKDMMPALEHITDVEYSFNKPEWIDPERFVEDYITKKGNGWLNFKPTITWERGHNQAKDDLKDPFTGQLILKRGDAVNMLLFPTDALERVFNNIVSNAQAHGFTDKRRKDYELRFSWHTDDIALIVEIENNGTAIPLDRDTASLLEYGVSSALHQNGHNGIGCNEIDDIMRRYDGKVEIVSSPENEFTVKYLLTFNRSNIVQSFNL